MTRLALAGDLDNDNDKIGGGATCKVWSINMVFPQIDMLLVCWSVDCSVIEWSVLSVGAEVDD